MIGRNILRILVPLSLFLLTTAALPVFAQEPPTVSIVSPTEGSVVSGTVTVEVDATDDEDAAGTLIVEMSIDDDAFATPIAMTYNETSGLYEASWDTTLVDDGPHTIDARATDSALNITNATQVSVTVDNVDEPPTVSIVSPTEGSIVSGTVTVKVDATDNEDAAGTLTVEMSIDDASFATPIAMTYYETSDLYEASWDTTQVDDGSHTIDARATDSALNTTTATQVSVTVGIVDEPPPDGIPPGQLVRRGISGSVVYVGGDEIVISTKFGNVTVYYGPETRIDAPPEKDVGPEAMEVGGKVAVSLVKPENEEPPENGESLENGEPPAPSFRTVVARRIVVHPGKPQCNQLLGVVQARGKGKVKLLGKDGNILDLDVEEPPPDGDQPPEVGDDVKLLVCNGKVLDTLRTQKIAERLARFQAAAEERDAKRAARVAELQQKHEERLLARLENTVTNAPPEARSNAEKARGKAKDRDKGPPNKDRGPPGRGKI